MAITATIALSNSSPKSGQKVGVVCTVSNSGAAAVNVIGVAPICPPTGATKGSTPVALGQPSIGPGQTVAVAASGTLKVTWDVVAHAPITSYGVGAEDDSLAYDVGAIISTSDGATTVATPSTMTVGYPAR